MLSTPERSKPQGRTEMLLAAAALLTAMLSACAGTALSPAPAASSGPTPASTAALSTTSAEPPSVPPSPAALPADAAIRMLAYADRVRQMTPAELSQETSRLTTPTSPLEQFQLAITLSQQRQTPDLVRAQELLARVLGNNDALTLHPLARLLATRYAEQRRVEELLDKQNQQTRDVQRRLDQTTERLQALKAIERSLTSRPPTSAPTPRGNTP